MNHSPDSPPCWSPFSLNVSSLNGGSSPHTIASYRDTFRLLLYFAQKRLRKATLATCAGRPDAPFLGAFLDGLEPTAAMARGAGICA